MNEEIQAQAIVALYYSNNVIGVACYNELTNSVSTDSLPVSIEDFESILTNIKLEFSPTLFLLHSKIVAHRQLLDIVLTKSASSDQTQVDDYAFQVPKSSAWHVDTARNLIQTTVVIKGTSRVSGAGSKYEDYHILASRIEMENAHVVSSFGALVSYLQAKIFNFDEGRVILADITTIEWKSFLRLDETAMRYSLNVTSFIKREY
jgi:hypothetical protein